MSVKQSGAYLGNKKIEVTHEYSGATMITAAPLDNQGDASSFSPTDLVGTSMATCMLTIMAIYAERHGLDLRGSRFSVEKKMSTEGPRRIAALRVEFHLPAGLAEEHREALERAAAGCPVKRSLDKEVQVETRFAYNV